MYLIVGLGNPEEEYSKIINDPVLDTVTVDDASYFQMMFGANAETRKEFMLR